MKIRALFAPLFAAFVLPAAPAFADACEDLWFTRNLIMDRAGHCFSTSLGKALFDNGDCKGKSIKLSSKAAKVVAAIRAREKEFACKVDTTRTTLAMDDMAMRRKLVDMPLADETESSCIGWAEPKTDLYVAQSKKSGTVGRIDPGDNVAYSHENMGKLNWSYVRVYSKDWKTFKSAGWLTTGEREAKCENYAG